MKIYTKTGDKGTTRLVDGSCVEKFNPRVEAYGTVDELNSYVGVIRAHLQNAASLNQIDGYLEKIQRHLFSLGSLLATADQKVFEKMPQITPAHASELEQQIDLMTAPLEPLKNFILPGGHITASQAHVARTVCRRAERKVAEMMSQETHYSDVLIYLNRLSDFFFTLSRYLNHLHQVPDVIWKS